ncbi:hypothetical protein F4813DRAFT_292940 [Daldinia decipiens]|uniref:uncharacterized protein n=1 Tax=Daldinia decipiens TaxID=326647 RepID=UPI0020C3ADEE|nr:uncharacterized protein F4813DRAFT_292940 [Daldinia decipiens]KAI1660392.1 hypothetical protein F4813DRAFT_292940 [Daldinia decipiens]
MAQANQRKLAKLSAEEIRYIINHVFLPPWLPHENDYEVENEEALLKTVIQALYEFREYVQGDEVNAVDLAITTMEHLHRNRDLAGSRSSTGRKGLLEAFDLLNQKVGGTVACHIQAQNCGVLFSRLDTSVYVEMFELSPSNQAVISTEGRLRRIFPGAAVSIPLSVFQTCEFQDTVAYTLTKMTHQSAPDTQPQVRKSNKMHDEDRDTTHPKMITELFFAFLLSMGNEVEVTKIWKNTREEVFWQDAELPWRRSALWLLIRVVLQLLFTRSASSPTCPDHIYKAFMIYFMAQILVQGRKSLSSDLLVSMSAKISRRYHKVVRPIPGSIVEFVNSTLSETDQILQDRWSRIREENSAPNSLEGLQDLDFHQDTHMSLSRLVDFINDIGNREKINLHLTVQMSCPLNDYGSQVPPVASSTNNMHVMYELALFESWVASNLQSWLEANEESDDATGILRQRIEDYYRIAFSRYEGNPELSSIMILTILDLWVASDKSAIRNCKLLDMYEPGIPSNLLENLNLPTKSQMIRLRDIEKYLVDRRSQARFPYEAINDFGSSNCFSVQFFNQSIKHKTLRASIINKASQDRKAKREEFQQKKDEYDRLMLMFDNIEHDTVTRINSITGEHCEDCAKNCRKCDIPRQAGQIKIGIHEWPLPRNELQEKSTVFELQVPCSFGHWRDTTVFVLYDILKLRYSVEEKPVAQYKLAGCLSGYFCEFDSRQRIILLSGVKSHTGTHRRMKAIATKTVDDVCLENGLRLKYYDSSNNLFTTSFTPTDDVVELCTYSLPNGPMNKISPIQPFIHRVPLEPAGPPPNKVIATQSTCPTDLSLEEYKALASLPLGFLLQWQNILLQLASPSIDFRKEETALVISQCIFQVGPPDGHNVFRDSHKILVDMQFSRALLGNLNKALARIKKNWQSFQAHGIFVSIARRLLSLTSSQNEKNRWLNFLADIRKITSEWIHDLEDKIQGATDDNVKDELRYRLVKITLICADTFNIEEENLRSLLAVSDSACTMIRCSIVINEGRNCIPRKADDWTSIMYRRWERLAYRAFNILAEEITAKGSPALNNAIKKTWSDFPVAGKWTIQKKPYHHWIINQSTLDNGDSHLYVVFSLLTGELFVNGSPLGRLPREYEKHHMYSVLFGKSILEVVPSSVPGMRFSSKNSFNKHSLNFGLDKPTETLLVRAVFDNETFELVPRSILQKLFPIMFIDNFVHWYNKAHGYVEFCPQELPWTHSENNWKLVRSDTASHCWRLCKGSKFLVNINSHTAKEIFKTNLKRLEELAWTHIILQDHSVDIEFPRLKLGFHLKQGETSIYSHQFRGMSVDEDQSIGALIGLQSMLVLKGNNGRVRRKALIPNGNIAFNKHGQHVRVDIEKQSSTKACVYEVDGLIGRLINNGSLQGKLLLSYLHALTSFPLPDPLTGKTGTEEALYILRSAAVRSFIKLTEENLDLLKNIALLTPARCYYPANEQEMQTVVWDQRLDFLAQHDGFYQAVRSIFDQANNSKFFHPDSHVSPPALHQVEQSLLRRDIIRSSTFRVSGFGAEDHTTSSDRVYQGRDNNQSSEKASRVYVMSKIIFREHFALNENPVADLGEYIWEFLSRYDVLGPRPINSSSPEIQVNYDSTLLLGSTEFIAKHWIQICQLLSNRTTEHNKFKVMFWLSTISFANDADMTILQVLASFFTVPGIALSPPTADIFRLSLGSCVNNSHIKPVIYDSCRSFQESPEADLSPSAWESSSAFRARQSQTFQNKKTEAVRTFCGKLETQWPCENPTSPYCTGSVEWWKYINVDLAMTKVTELFRPRYHNRLLKNYLNQIGGNIPPHVIPNRISRFSPTIPPWNCTRKPGFTSNDEIFTLPAPLMLLCTDITQSISLTNNDSNEAPQLPFLLSRLDKQVQSRYDRRYVSDLKNSTQSLQGWRKEYRLTKGVQELEELLVRHRDSCQEVVEKNYRAIEESVMSHQGGKRSTLRALLSSTHQWPRLSPSFFLQRLCRSKWQKLPEDWKTCIIHYGITISQLQRADRLLRAVHNPSVLVSELRNPGHMNWQPRDQPESLLLEIEGDLMIRPVQEQIAKNMRSPEGGKNAVMQLNMGEGKSSVIVPMVATALADGSRLVRVIVGKPQSRQMYQMLISKLGGLLDRQIFHLPFSRAVKVENPEILAMRDMFEACKTNGGIFLMQPEHVLSFKLMGIECILTGKEHIGRALVQSQEYLNTNTRDIVDESDENFSVKFELVYTMGTQRPTEYSPERWVCIHQVLDVVREVILEVRTDLSGALEVHSQYPGCFPRTRILQLDAADQILSRVTERICATGLNGFPITRQQKHVRQAIIRYITEVQPAATDIALVEDPGLKGFWTRASQTLLLLRGLIAGGVLGFAFGHKRWRVDYGLDSNRQPSTKLAVPYRAKDSPSLRSEFSHPDVVIILTSLSYYYGGLEYEDLLQTFKHLLRSDQADQEFGVWVKDAENLSDTSKTLVGINLEDAECTQSLFNSFRHAKGVIDYFLARIVFPKEMKEFSHRLSASGWDIGEVKTHPTTGFSGTNDSRQVLPLDVEQLDLEDQKHTNALVLENLLHSKNSVTLLPPRQESDNSVAEMLLNIITKLDPPTRVILDVGAQILELNNFEVARTWLYKTSDDNNIQAAIFVDDHDELYVLDRKGHLEPLHTSPFASQLDMCVVFLDEAHTRGTDLKLPKDYRAAVTLGANLTKDRLVQACMRMRMLAEGQSVVFCVPDEVQRKIRAHRADIGLPADQDISVLDILAWSIGETWRDIHRSMALWANQGRRNENHRNIWAEARSGGKVNLTRGLADKYLEEEAKTLDYRYRPRPDSDAITPSQVAGTDTTDLISLRCNEFKNLKLNSAELQEEEERELSPEIEQERQDQRPPEAVPAIHTIHKDIKEFIDSGMIIERSAGYMPAFLALRNTSAGARFDVSQFRPGLLVSNEFANTIKRGGASDYLDSYQRTIQWILTGAPPSDEDSTDTLVEHMMVISPHEAQVLLPMIMKSKAVALHLYAPRANLGYCKLDKLDLYTVPERLASRKVPQSLITELNLFAGQLYFDSYEQYVDACRFLGISCSTPREGEEIAADGFIAKDSTGRVGGESGLKSSPVAFFKILHTKIRRNCESIEKTHMGKLLDNQLLRPSDFEQQ